MVIDESELVKDDSHLYSKQEQDESVDEDNDENPLVFKIDKQKDEKEIKSTASCPVSIDQNPLETSIQQFQEDDNKSLRLTICEQHNEKTSSNLNRNFKLLIDDLHLSCSPFIKYKMPYLLLEDTSDPLKKYLPNNYMNYLDSFILLLDSQCVTNGSIISPNRSNNNRETNEEIKTKIHQFLSMHLTRSFGDKEIQKLYADFKSRGGISTNTCGIQRKLMLKNIEYEVSNENNQSKPKFDCLDIFNRQHLAVLYINQCETSPLYPNICQKPRVINMKFYTENDMTLGSFLVRNCFRQEYKCANEYCSVPIVFHTRAFVHADTKITIRISIIPNTAQNQSQNESSQSQTLNSNTNSNNSKSMSHQSNMSILSVSSLLPKSPSQSNSQPANQQQAQSVQSLVPDQTLPTSANINQPIYDDINIFMWSVCKKCNKSTKKVAMSPDTWSFSLAKFLELTFHAQSAYHQFNSESNEPECNHSLFHDNYQYFRYKNVVTVFSTEKIVIKKLYLPEIQIKRLEHAKKREEYIEEIKEIHEKGLTQTATLIERLNQLKIQILSEKQIQKIDQYLVQINNDCSLKTKIEKINLILTNNLQEAFKTTNEINYAMVDFLMIDLKKYLANFTIYWNNKIIELFSNKKTKSDDEIKLPQSFNESVDSQQGNVFLIQVKHILIVQLKNFLVKIKNS